jgi:hypothetical protein
MPACWGYCFDGGGGNLGGKEEGVEGGAKMQILLITIMIVNHYGLLHSFNLNDH